MGLGLTISKLILNELGGEIRLDSEKDKGTTFEFKMPIAIEMNFEEEEKVPIERSRKEITKYRKSTEHLPIIASLLDESDF